MASCRTGRLPLIGDPFMDAHDLGGAYPAFYWMIAGFGSVALTWTIKLQTPEKYVKYRGPDNPYVRQRKKRFPGGLFFFGWGNNGLNRDCNLLEHECWAGYTGKQYTL
jgi:hypothetical protein